MEVNIEKFSEQLMCRYLLSGILPPYIIWILFLHELFEINRLVKLIGFGTWIADETFGV